MRYIYGVILFVFSVLALYFSTRIFYRKKKENYVKAFSITAFASSLWCLGYSLMQITDDVDVFLYARAAGFIGIVLFLNACQFLIGIVAKFQKKTYIIFAIEALCGLVVLIIILNPATITAEMTSIGIITTFKNQAISVMYTLYTIVVAIGFVAMSIHIIGKKYMKHIRQFGRNLLVVEAIIICGMIVDTVLPAFGVNMNIPASTIVQFIGLEIIYYAVHAIDRNRLNVQNMTGYIYQSFKSPLLIFDRENKLNIINNEARKLFSIDNEQDFEDIEFWKTYFKMDSPNNVENADETIVFDAEFIKKDEIVIPCRVYVDPIYDDFKDYIGYIVMVSDMTALVNKAKELEESRNEAMRANQAKSQFLANMSHEIRTPMNSIIGFSELALDDSINDASREYFEDIHRSAQSLLAIINDILDISKIESGKMELINGEYSPNDVFKDVSRIIKMQAYRKKLEYKAEISDNFPGKLLGDRVKIRAILVNLLNNGIKYTREGFVKLKADFEAKDNDHGIVRFEISDSGVGIKDEELDSIFDIFQRVDETNNGTAEGTGLGLSITKGYVELMKGNIRVSSKYGEGTTFVIEFEQKILEHEKFDEDDSKNVTEIKKLHIKDANILAVDDIDLNIKLLELALGQYGIKIDTALTGKEAIELCKNKKYDIILMDQMMPELDGIESMKEIRLIAEHYSKGSASKIIVLTANAIDGAREELLGLGFDDYLTKPIDIAALEKTLIKYLPDDKYYFS